MNFWLQCVHWLTCADLERIPSLDGKRSNDRFRCTVCIEYGSDDESTTFTRNNKGAHLRTSKHNISLSIRTRKLKERTLAQEQNECVSPGHADLLPLPEIFPTIPVSQGDGVAEVFGRFRRLGLSFLDENGEQVKFSAGTDGERNRTQNEETDVESGWSDIESDDAGHPLEWAAQDHQSTDYWPYPSKTVSGGEFQM